MAGLTEDGFTVETFEDIRTGMNEQMQSAFGPSIDVSDGAIEGVTIGIVAERLAELWELAEAVVNAGDPDTATGAQQDALCALTGTQRAAAEPSSALLTLTGDDATPVPAGSTASVTGTEAEFSTDEDATLALATAWVAATLYPTVGIFRSNADRVYYLTAAGTSAGSGGPDTTDEEITDGTCEWRYVGEGLAYATDVPATCTEDGPTVATSGSIVNIETPIGGWNGVMNLTDATLGSDIETSEDLRIRREIELATPGSSPPDAIRAELLDVDGVTAVTVFYNPTDTTDGDGVPPHSVEALVQGGDPQDIGEKLFAAVAAGIGTYGDQTPVTVEDSAGNEWEILYSRPDELLIWVRVDVTKDPDTFPEDGEDQIKAAIVAYGDAQKAGKNAVAGALAAQVYGITGVLEVTVCYIGLADPPIASTTIPASTRQLAVYDTSRIAVTLVDGVP